MKVLVIGAGIGGLGAAVGLSDRGFDVDVIEINPLSRRRLPPHAQGLAVPFIESSGTKLHYEETGSGDPIVQTGHDVNLEEPDAFSRALAEFFGAVERGTWRRRDPRADPAMSVFMSDKERPTDVAR